MPATHSPFTHRDEVIAAWREAANVSAHHNDVPIAKKCENELPAQSSAAIITQNLRKRTPSGTLSLLTPPAGDKP